MNPITTKTPPNRLIALTGVAGVGKSTLASMLRGHLGFAIADTTLTLHRFLTVQDPVITFSDDSLHDVAPASTPRFRPIDDGRWLEVREPEVAS